MGYPEEKARAEKLRALARDWEKCSFHDLGIRVLSLSLAGLRAPLPQDVHQAYQRMHARWQQLKPQPEQRPRLPMTSVNRGAAT